MVRPQCPISFFRIAPCPCCRGGAGPLSGRLGFRKIKHSGLNRFEDGVPDKGTGAKNLNTDELAFGIEFGCDIRTDLDTAGLRLIRYGQMKNVILLEICHTRFVHNTLCQKILAKLTGSR